MKKQMQIACILYTYILLLLLYPVTTLAQPILQTGPGDLPDEWIDKDTRHKVIRLCRMEGRSGSFYFHNNPFAGDDMIFYNSSKNGRQIYSVNLTTLQTQQITYSPASMQGEIVAAISREVYYQIKDTVFATHIDTKKTRRVFVFPPDFRASITTLNASETLLAGAKASDDEKKIFQQYPDKSQYFNRIYEAKLPCTLFTIDLKKGTLNKIYTDSAWLNHVQFSNTDPNLLMFCHEGPWHKVDRIHTIDVKTGKVSNLHKRTMDMEIAGHEWFGPDGKTIWFDLQTPRSVQFFVAGVNVKTGEETKYALARDEWSIHFTLSNDQSMFAGDGGDPGQVARAKDGRWIYLFRPNGDKFESEKLVNMQHHNYKSEPNVHFSPDGKWIIFRANFEGNDEVYAVEVAKTLTKQ